MTISRGGPFTRAELETMPDDGRRYELIGGSLIVTGAPFTRAERDAWPEDGRRHELIDGTLVVTPSPSADHQRVLRGLFRLLDATCPDEFEVLFAPFDVALGDDTVVQPDLLVARRDNVTERELSGPPLLVVEVLSPSTRLLDLMTKRASYEAGGAGSYWVVDPTELTLTAWDLVDGTYVEVAHVEGQQSFTATRPFEVTVVPAGLRD